MNAKRRDVKQVIAYGAKAPESARRHFLITARQSKRRSGLSIVFRGSNSNK